ncbi:NADPH:quinone reductase-like Zn-dependent oxidoreductase [Haloactinopolyspora alba]|uniref:NADPH:quinone reductase-like Zn-dependent oxidoreductase n=2 Tax=Haloactinopolyspora alba TaxID=648780 RepID=A0A2P8E573_9ACTN|nr:NADP-dependent oxidoreductase [Haloactinopolyspora alba]PSL04610.1 NADPH:quinone reductase-like Zn-dependent oxidoreductase [Haloactinopolyspora alba]
MTYARYGGPEVLELTTDRPKPKVPPGFALVRVVASAVNPVDWKLMAGGLDPLMDVHFPVVPGWDVAGVVEELGVDTYQFEVGDEVVANGRRDEVQHGTAAEYVSLPARVLARKPASLSWEQAAGLPLAGLTAYQTVRRLGVGADDTVLIHGGAGGVGQTGVQVARALGARVIATASERNHDHLRALGAEPVSYGDGLTERVRGLAPDSVTVVADFVGGVLDTTLAVLAPGGRHASIADAEVEQHGGRWIWVVSDGADLASLGELADAGKLTVDVSSTYPLERLADAYRESMGGHTRGKIVVTTGD